MKKKSKKYKLKTKASAKKRFKITGTGKVRRRYSGLRHLLSHRSSKNKRPKRKDGDVSEADREKMKLMLHL